ncbi:DUF2653 family protein [Paenibacillus agricola]|uniref:DUF2653 family protein n=1 Tax=Paenibacillus agricola TaxID=2716264 RepID=A0ABX0JJQ6_9BACL|nr:DUF2653 family protein [Paenibacillus agricola]NHN35307.1 DUF2653 family protein [Paenibacillus agricola]
MKIWFNEQDIIDSACVFGAHTYNEDIQDIKAELHHEEGKGISATLKIQKDQRTYELSEQDIIDASAIYLEEYHKFDPNQLLIQLLFEETNGFSAEIEFLSSQTVV